VLDVDLRVLCTPYAPISHLSRLSSSAALFLRATAATVGAEKPEPGFEAFRVLASVPNPVRTGRTFTLSLASPEEDRVWLEAFDVAGRRVARGPTRAVSAGVTRLEWQIRLKPGLYFLRAVSQRGRSADARVVVSN
jgi:hypothetical protein